MFAKFDYDIYETDSFTVYDGRILAENKTDTLDVKLHLENGMDRVVNGGYQTETWTTVCVMTEHWKKCFRMAGKPENGVTTESESTYWTYICNSFYYDDEGSSPGPLGSGEGGGGNGAPDGADNWNEIDPCPAQARGGIGTDFVVITDPCDPLWVPALPPAEYNPFVYDTIRIDPSNHIQDSFPCLYGLLKDTLLDPNKISQMVLFDAFNVQQYSHLTFKLSDTMGFGSPTARTRPGRSWIDDNDKLHFEDTILLNPYFMERMTKEDKIATILHESVHAYINFIFEQYIRHEIDSNNVKSLFPNHWNHFMGRPPSEAMHHIIMMDKYIQTLAGYIYRYYNSSATAIQKGIGSEALAWGGVHQQAGWAGITQNRYITDPCKIEAINWVGENATASLSGPFTNSCGVWNLPYTDSLKMTAPCK
jgi:hypothetical protein